MPSLMYGRLLENYCAGTLSDSQLDAAVTVKKWITAAEATEIRAEKVRRDQAAAAAEALTTVEENA